MSNFHASKTHGLVDMNRTRPKSKLRKRRNKECARLRKAERRVTKKVL